MSHPLSRGEAPHDVIGDAGAQHLALRVLHDDRGACAPAQPDCARAQHHTLGRGTAGEHHHQRGLARTIGSGDGHVFPGVDVHRDRTERVDGGARVAEAHVDERAPEVARRRHH